MSSLSSRSCRQKSSQLSARESRSGVMLPSAHESARRRPILLFELAPRCFPGDACLVTYPFRPPHYTTPSDKGKKSKHSRPLPIVCLGLVLCSVHRQNTNVRCWGGRYFCLGRLDMFPFALAIALRQRWRNF